MKQFFRSITARIVIAMALLLAGTILLTVLMNTFFLADYYEQSKCAALQETYQIIDLASRRGTIGTEGFSVQLETVVDRENIDVIVFSSDGSVVLATANNYDELRDQFMTLILFQEGGQDETIARTDNYVLRHQTDTRLQSEYLVLWGTLYDGNFIMLRSALSSISDTADLSNRFLFMTGILAAAFGIVIMYLITRRMTKPIVRLTEISDRMADLDFDAKYTGSSYQEVDELGENMNRLSENLEQTISELKSANNELRLDNERKTEIDLERKEFLSNVSHELKTPLALIRGYAEGLSEGITGDPESQAFYCEVIADEAEKMSRMVGKLLTLNQLESGGEKASMERFDVVSLIRGVLSANSLLFDQEGITVDFPVTESVMVWADEFLTEEVLTNYVSNAIHHCKNEKLIRIRIEKRESTVRIFVYNTGDQIPEESLEKIWDKFYKVDKARTREYGGSGIGLSIVKAIMDSMHQSCGADNLPGGVEFYLDLDAEPRSIARPEQE